MEQAAEVHVTSDPYRNWLVWLNERLVGRFPRVGDALALAAMLECSPRERAGVTPL